jgi:hypothetical protein
MLGKRVLMVYSLKVAIYLEMKKDVSDVAKDCATGLKTVVTLSYQKVSAVSHVRTFDYIM